MVGAVVLAVAVGILGFALFTTYEVARHPSAWLGGQKSTLSVSSNGPDAAFTWTSEGYNVTFTDTSTDNGSRITSWEWDFGDGTGFVGPAPPLHTYTTTCVRCTEDVSLVTTDAAGYRSVATASVTVQRTGSSNGLGTSPASQFHLPSFGPLTSDLPGTLELLVIMFLIGGSAANAARNLLSREPETVRVPVRTTP